MTLSGRPSGFCDVCNSDADLVEEDEMNAEGPARKGRRAVDGFAVG